MSPSPSPEEMASTIASTGCEHIQDVINAMGGDIVGNMDNEGLAFMNWFVSTSPPDTQAAPQPQEK